MNYLAHIFLSGDDRRIQIGNFVGDAVKERACFFREESRSVTGVVRSFPAGCLREMSYDVGGGYKLLIININLSVWKNY